MGEGYRTDAKMNGLEPIHTMAERQNGLVWPGSDPI
jgi:hypothetical protein